MHISDNRGTTNSTLTEPRMYLECSNCGRGLRSNERLEYPDCPNCGHIDAINVMVSNYILNYSMERIFQEILGIDLEQFRSGIIMTLEELYRLINSKPQKEVEALAFLLLFLSLRNEEGSNSYNIALSYVFASIVEQVCEPYA